MKKKTKKLQLSKETINLLSDVQGGIGGSDPYSAQAACSKAMDCTFTCQPK